VALTLFVFSGRRGFAFMQSSRIEDHMVSYFPVAEAENLGDSSSVP